MVISFTPSAPPLVTNSDEVIRVGNTRVTLDVVVMAFNQGLTPEEIVYQYPSLNLADVYAVISYFLKNQSEIEAYLHKRRQKAQVIRQQNEAKFSPQGIRQRLLSRSQR